jgi:uncharacterized membrane protein
MLDLHTPDTLRYFLTHAQPAAHGNVGANDGGMLNLLDQILDNITRLFDDAGSPPPAGTLEWLPGLHTLADNPHPLLVHFPIAFLTVFFVLEWYAVVARKKNMQQLAGLLLYSGTIGAIATAAAGLYAAKTVPHSQEVHEIMEWHGGIGLFVTGTAIILSLWRRFSRAPHTTMTKTFSLILATLMTVALFFGADLGGFMVYRYGVGVKAVKQAENHTHELHDHDAGPHQ